MSAWSLADSFGLFRRRTRFAPLRPITPSTVNTWSSSSGCSSWNEHRSSLSTSGSRGRTCQCCPFRRTRTRPRTRVNVRPPTADHFRPPKPGPLHQNDRRPLVPYRGLTNLHKLVKARPVYIRLPLWWPPHLPVLVRVDQLLGFCPRKERVKNRNHVRAGRCTSLTPMLGDEGPQAAR